VYTWVHQEWREGFPVESALLEECGDEVRHVHETEWISKFPNLLNKRKYSFRGGKPPIIREIKDYRARFVFNSGGLRGIHWSHDLDRYSVFVYTGGGTEWLPGDGAPGWTGDDIWFSDRIEAVKARDDFRRLRHSSWLPDYSN
jgi:hypothetical protein